MTQSMPVKANVDASTSARRPMRVAGLSGKAKSCKRLMPGSESL